MSEEYEYDYKAIEDFLNQSKLSDKFGFEQLVNTLKEGDFKNLWADFGKYIKELFLYEINNNSQLIIKIIVLVIVAAIFTEITKSMVNSGVSETAFYVTYMLLITLLLNGFILSAEIVKEGLEAILGFMKVLMPTFIIAVGLCSGSVTAVAFYEATFLLIGMIEYIFLNLALPLVYFYVILNLINNIYKEEILSKFADFLKNVYQWMIKALYAGVIGLNVVQGIVLPMVDSAKLNALTKTISAIPGVGDVVGGASSVVMGAASVVKNAMGVAGIIVLIVIIVVPIIKLVTLSLMYRLVSGLVQPISDTRIVKSISVVADGIVMLIRLMTTTMILFFITIAIICVGTNTNYYGSM